MRSGFSLPTPASLAGGLTLTLALALTAGLPTPLPGQSAEARDAADTLRAHYFRQDFAGGARAGEALVALFPGAVEVCGWHAINLARVSGRAQEALAFTTEMLERWPDTPWPLIAHSIAVSYQPDRLEEGVQVAEEAFARAPHEPHTLWARGLTLHRAARHDDVVALADSVLPHPWAELLVLKANALLVSARGDEEQAERALAVFAEARELDPTNVNAHFFPASNLVANRRVDEALPLLERALELAPHSAGIRQRWWTAVQARTDLSAEEKRALVEGEIAELAAGDPPPDLLSAAASVLRQMGAHEGVGPLEERILEGHADSPEAEWVVINRYRALRDSVSRKTVADEEEARTRAREMLREFVGRPSHRVPPLLGDAYLSLFMEVRGDEELPPEELLQVVQGMAGHNRMNPQITHAEGPMALAERGVYFREAEALVREGFDLSRERLEATRSVMEELGLYQESADRMMATMHDALGWVFFHEGRIQEARQELERAYELSPDHPGTLYHLGRLAEAAGELEEAEYRYGRGRNAELAGGSKRSTEALERLFRERHGSLEGYEEYLERLSEVDRAYRRNKVAASRIAEPEAAPSFELEWLHGGRYESSAHAGKITVINFWGVWCGPCVREAPQIQRFHEKYKDDPGVVFLTIDYQDDPDRVREWMAEKEYGFPVLLDDGFVRRARVSAFPTTWFLDREGRIVFRHIGASEVVFEEFVWRVELLQEEAEAGAR